LVAVLVAAFFIIRNLRKTTKAVKKVERSSGTSSGGRRSGRGGAPNPSGVIGAGGISGSGESGTRNSKQRMAAHLPTPSEVNQMEYDELLENETAETQIEDAMNSSFSRPHGPNMSNVTGTTSPMPDHSGLPKASLDFSSPSAGIEGGAVTGYFDIPVRIQNRPGRYSMSTDPRTSIDSQGQQPPGLVWNQQQQQYQRPRIISDASERSGPESVGVGSPLQPAELGIDGGFIPELPSVLQSPEEDAGDMAQHQNQGQIPQRARPFSNISALSGMSGFGASAQMQQQYQQQQQPLMSGHQRNWSDDSNGMPNDTPGHTPAHSPGQTPGHTPSHSRDRSNIYQQAHHQPIQQPQPFQPQQQQQQAPKLDVVSEVAEHMHGHYGPINAVAGQTRAAADVEIDISSPIAP
jgi:hypothetical protein